MTTMTERWEQERLRLQQKRDELRVQIDLGKKEARDAWEQVEGTWNRLEGKMGQIKREGEDAADDVKAALDTLFDEVRDGFDRVRKLL